MVVLLLLPVQSPSPTAGPRRARAVGVVDAVQDAAERPAAGHVHAAAVPDQDPRPVDLVDAASTAAPVPPPPGLGGGSGLHGCVMTLLPSCWACCSSRPTRRRPVRWPSGQPAKYVPSVIARCLKRESCAGGHQRRRVDRDRRRLDLLGLGRARSSACVDLAAHDDLRAVAVEHDLVACVVDLMPPAVERRLRRRLEQLSSFSSATRSRGGRARPRAPAPTAACRRWRPSDTARRRCAPGAIVPAAPARSKYPCCWSGPPLSRIFVIHVGPRRASTFVKLAAAAVGASVAVIWPGVGHSASVLALRAASPARSERRRCSRASAARA